MKWSVYKLNNLLQSRFLELLKLFTREKITHPVKTTGEKRHYSFSFQIFMNKTQKVIKNKYLRFH